MLNPLENLGLNIPGGAVLGGVKIIILICFVFYMVFALLVIRQVTKMSETLSVGVEPWLRIISIFHFLLALSTFVVALVIL